MDRSGTYVSELAFRTFITVLEDGENEKTPVLQEHTLNDVFMRIITISN